MMQKPLRILIDKDAIKMNGIPLFELCLGLGCQDVAVTAPQAGLNITARRFG